MKKNILIATIILCLIHSKTIFGMNKDRAQLAVVIQRPQKHYNEMGHPSGYLHELLNHEGKPILNCMSNSEDVPQRLLAVALDENKNLKSNWKIRTSDLRGDLYVYARLLKGIG